MAVCCTANAARADVPNIDWNNLHSVEQLIAAWPQWTGELFAALDLDRPGLEKVRRAYQAGDLPAACRHLLDYYQTCDSGSWLRWTEPVTVNPDARHDPLADLVMQDRIISQDRPGPLVRMPDGRMDWLDRGPVNDIEWTVFLNRHIFIRALTGAYRATGDPAYVEKIDEFLRDWIVSSQPPPESKQQREGNWMWRPMEMGIRTFSWAPAFYGLMDCPQLRPATRIMMLRSLLDHALGLRQDHSRSGNHATLDLSALSLLGAAWPEFRESNEWLHYSVDYLMKDFSHQVYPDGVQKELTSHYHRYATGNYERLAEVCRNAHLDAAADLDKAIESMWNYTALVLRPDGTNPLNNDSDRERMASEVIDRAGLYNRSDWLYIATNGKQGTQPEGPPSVVFPWAGQLIMRSGYDAEAQWAFFDMGPSGWGSHAHFDRLHLSLAAFGRDLLVDSGRFAYDGQLADKFRDPYARHTRGHNSIVIDGCGQSRANSEAQQPLTADQYRITDDYDFGRQSCDGYTDLQGQARHTRAVMYVRGKFWVVVDRIETDRPRQIEVDWHYHPHCTVEQVGAAVRSTDAEAGNLGIAPLGDVAWDVRIVQGQEQPVLQGWYSERYNSSVPSATAVYSASVQRQGATFAWLLLPYRGDSAFEAPAQLLAVDAAGALLNVMFEGKKYTLMVPLSSARQPALKINP
ncbi:MAG: alginate lyase family protein [Phycisphaeraceae bacterium]|nr:alginate lyase family protein [Phycisphaeraceae bacterium]